MRSDNIAIPNDTLGILEKGYYVTDVGNCEMIAYKVDGSVGKIGGSMTGNAKINGANLSNLIRTIVGKNNIAAFGEAEEPLDAE